MPISALLARPDFTDGGVKGSYAQVVRSKEAIEAEEEKRQEHERARLQEEEERTKEEQRKREKREKDKKEAEEIKNVMKKK